MVQLHGRDAEVRIGNPTQRPLAVSITLYRDATTPGKPVTLGDSLRARISPSTFTLQPGVEQTVRLRVQASVRQGEVLRLAVTFTPVEEPEPQPRPTMRFIMAVRYLVRVEVRP